MNAAKILIVDDLESNLRLLSSLVTPLGHTALVAADGAAALEQMSRQPVDLVLLDVMMPKMSGCEVLEQVKGDPALRHIPVIMISGIDEMDSIVRCIRAGADDYLIKPFNPYLLRARIDSSLEKKRLHDQEQVYQRQIEEYNLRLEERVRVQVEQILGTQQATIFAMSKLADSRDPDTGEHLERMREYSKSLCEQLRRLPKHAPVIDDTFVANVYAAAALHDIGKVGIPDRILQKPGKLTPEEFNVMKAHTTIGADTLRAVDRSHPGNAFVRMGIQIAETHHEKWDGAGYPHGLLAEEIPLVGRILALADVYDALTSKRCYKAAYSHEKSKDIILADSGRHFDPDVVAAFVAEEARFLDIRRKFQDSDKSLLL